MYSEAEAARLLRVAPSTLHYWLEGGTQRSRRYLPVIREQPKGGRPPVTWAEFIECGWLRQYRRVDRVPMPELRAFIALMREKYEVPYPLAHFLPFANEGKLITKQAQADAGLDPDFCLIAEISGQLVLTAPADEFVGRVDWKDDMPVAWRPSEDRESIVRIQPDVRFGRPAVKGISTEVLWEQVEAGAEVREVADDFGLTVPDVRWAVSYESAAHAA